MPARKTSTRAKTSDAADSIGKLQFKVVTEATKTLEKLNSIPDTVKELKAQVDEIKESFAYELKEKEVELNEKKTQLDVDFIAYQADLKAKQEALDLDLTEYRTKYARDLEQIKYDHSIAIRDADVSTADNIVKRYGNVIVNEDKWLTVQDLEEANEEHDKALVDSVTAEVEKRVKTAKDAEIRNMKHKYEMDLAIANKDIDNLTKEAENLRVENTSLKTAVQEQNKNIVSIAESATRPSVIHEQSSGKK